MKFSDYFKVVCIVMLLATLTNVSSASANHIKELFAKTEIADLNERSWQEDKGQDKRQQPAKDKRDQSQDRRTTVKEVPKAKPKLRPEHVDEKRETKRPAGKGRR